MAVPMDVIKKYAPACIFHENEQNYPCSVEFLLKGATLKWRTWTFASQCKDNQSPAVTQETGIPALALFKSDIWMVYTDSHSSQLLVTKSGDGVTWDEARQIPGQHTSVPAVAVFLNKLWIVYTDAHSAQLWVSCSSNGWDWEAARKIDGQKTSVPAIAVFENKLHMVYSSDNSSQLYHSQSDDGWNWGNTGEIDGQGTDVPALAVLGNSLVMVYPDSDHSGRLYSSHYTSANGWKEAHQFDQKAMQVALTTYDGWLVMTYSSSNSSQLWCSRSKDAINWQDTQTIGGQNGRFCPALVTNGDNIIMVYCGTESNKTLYMSTNYKADLVGRPDILNPTQQTLHDHPDQFYYLSLDGPHGSSLSDAGPLYYNTQFLEDPDNKTGPKLLHIHYIFLYQFQHGQTVRALRSGTEFNAEIWRLGEHQADVEHLEIVLRPSTSDIKDAYTVVSVLTEAHGDQKPYDINSIDWKDQTHPIISIGLNSHAVWNQKKESNPIDEGGAAGFVLIGDFLGDNGKNMWYPYESSSLVQIGLDSAGEPINDQLWAKYRGRLGDSYHVTLNGASYFDGSNLSTFDWDFVKIVEAGGRLIGKIPIDLYVAEGPGGPGGRGWIATS